MSTSPPRVLVVQNSSGSGVGRFAEWLVAEGCVLEVVGGENLPETLNGYSGVILLGGGFMPDNDERGPWLPKERALAKEAIDAGVPLLGICLGEQLLALVGGGQVTASSGETERGLVSIDLLPAAEQDPLFSGLSGEQLQMMQHHKDSVTGLPPEAVHLGTSQTCTVQAFRIGSAAWGVQFHPEAPPERIRTWDEDSLAKEGFDRSALIARAEEQRPENLRQSKALAARFAELVKQHAAQQVPG